MNVADLQSDSFKNGILSVVVVFHSTDDTDSLDQTLFSVATQEYESIEILVATDVVSEASAVALKKLIDGQPWRKAVVRSLTQVDCSGAPDRRAKLISHGAGMAKGQYLAFLNSGDKMYQHSYSQFINELEGTKYGAALGGIRIANVATLGDKQQVVSKTLLQQNLDSRFSALLAEFIPISSFVIDQSKLPFEKLSVAGLRRLEGMWLFIQLMDSTDISWHLSPVPLGEIAIYGASPVDWTDWRLHPDETNELVISAKLDSLLAQRSCSVSVLDLKNWVRDSAQNVWSKLKFDLMRDNQNIDVSVVLRLLDHAAENERVMMNTKLLNLQNKLNLDYQTQQKRISDLKRQLSDALEKASQSEQEKLAVESQLADWQNSNKELGLQIDRQSVELNRRSYVIARELGTNIHKLKAIIRKKIP